MVTDFYFGGQPSQKQLIMVSSRFKKKLDILSNFLTNYIQAGKTLIEEGFVHVQGGPPILRTEDLAKLR